MAQPQAASDVESTDIGESPFAFVQEPFDDVADPRAKVIAAVKAVMDAGLADGINHVWTDRHWDNDQELWVEIRAPALFFAIGFDSTWIPVLHEFGADIECRSSQGYTPLHEAAEQGDAGVCATLTGLGAHAAATTLAGSSALALAANCSL